MPQTIEACCKCKGMCGCRVSGPRHCMTAASKPKLKLLQHCVDTAPTCTPLWCQKRQSWCSIGQHQVHTEPVAAQAHGWMCAVGGQPDSQQNVGALCYQAATVTHMLNQQHAMHVDTAMASTRNNSTQLHTKRSNGHSHMRRGRRSNQGHRNCRM